MLQVIFNETETKNLLLQSQVPMLTVFYLPTDAQQSCFKRILKFTLKQLLHVLVQLPSSGSVLFQLTKVTVTKQSVKINRCSWFGGVAAYFIRSILVCVCVCVWCTVQNETK
jgi:hypothetical protein